MSFQAKRELLAQTGPRYRVAPLQQKRTILDEFVAATGYARKYAIRLLGQPSVPPSAPVTRARARTYGPDVVEALTVAWVYLANTFRFSGTFDTLYLCTFCLAATCRGYASR